MIPNIFISSTIQDLSHLRDSIRDLIIELGYNPIMSEYGEIGYLPTNSAEDSCYLALKDCQMAIVIVGKRYGTVSQNGLSVTHNEFRTTRERKIPVIFLINEEVLSFKRVYDANENIDDLSFPGMENPAKVFQFIKEFSESEINNGLIQFSNVQSAKNNLKKQFAHIVGDLLKKHFDPVKGEIKDILSEITTLRHILVKKDKEVAKKFARAFRFLLNEENKYIKEIAEFVSGSLEEGVPELLDKNSLKSYLESKNVQIQILNSEDAHKVLNISNDNEAFKSGIQQISYSELPFSTIRRRASLGGKPEYDVKPDNANDSSVVFGIGKTQYWANENANKLLEAMFERLIETTK